MLFLTRLCCQLDSLSLLEGRYLIETQILSGFVKTIEMHALTVDHHVRQLFGQFQLIFLLNNWQLKGNYKHMEMYHTIHYCFLMPSLLYSSLFARSHIHHLTLLPLLQHCLQQLLEWSKPQVCLTSSLWSGTSRLAPRVKENNLGFELALSET